MGCMCAFGMRDVLWSHVDMSVEWNKDDHLECILYCGTSNDSSCYLVDGYYMSLYELSDIWSIGII